MPAILVKVIEKSKLDLISRTQALKSIKDKRREKEGESLESQKSANELLLLLKTVASTATDPAVSLPGELCDSDGNKYYEAPLYVTKLRDRGKQGSLSAKCGSIPLRVSFDSTRAHWVKRGLALFCHDLD